jgi:ATP-dependent DNA helicase RecG
MYQGGGCFWLGVGSGKRNIILVRMILDELKKLIANRESERVEFKAWKNQFSFDGQEKFENRRCLLGYCVALGNEKGGYLLIGVDDKTGEIVGTNARFADDAKQRVYQKTGQKIEIEEVFDGSNKVFVVHIPSRPMGTLLKFAGVPLMRMSDSLEPMSDQEHSKILMEGQEDFSARVCETSSMESVDKDALEKLRELRAEKQSNNDKAAEGLSDERFLTDIALMRDGKLTYAGVILIAKKEFLDWNLGDTEICFEYRNRFGDEQSRNDRVNYREPFVLAYEKIWEKVASRQQTHSFISGLLRDEIPAFDQEVFREALFNAVCHRDYSQKGSVVIIQSPEGIEITNPGGFPPGVTQENIINVASTPRNRLLAEKFEKILPGVERSGWGVDRIFRYTIQQGKGLPDYSGSSEYFVRLFIPAMLKDAQFVQYLKKIADGKQELLSIENLLLLEKIRAGEKTGITLKTVGHLLEKGFIELYGKTRGARYVLAKRYYIDTGRLGERTRIVGLPRRNIKNGYYNI